MKRMIIAILVLFLFLTPIAAEEGSNEGVSESKIEENNKAILEKDRETLDNVASPRAIITKKLNVSRIVQENNYYCGPASIQMVLKYLGINRTQSHIASWVGTTQSGGTAAVEVAAYLRDVSGYSYVMRETKDRPLYNVVNTFNDGKPVIYNVRPHYFNNSYSKSTLHYVVGNGYSYDDSLSPYSISPSNIAITQLYLVDPFYSNVNSTLYVKMLEAVNMAWGYYIY